MAIKESEYIDNTSAGIGFFMFTVHSLMPVGALGVLLKKREHLDSEE